MSDPSSISYILWSADPATQRAIEIVLVPAAIVLVAIFAPLVLRLGRLFLLQRRLWSLTRNGDDLRSGDGPAALRETLLDSPLREVFEEFERRWSTAQLTETRDRAPVRLMDVFDDRPLLPFGPRRSLIPVLPGLFLGLGVFAALTGLIPSLTAMAAEEATGGATQAAWMADQLGLALRASAWGFLCAIGASLTGRLIEGGFRACSAGLDEVIENHYGSVSPGELAEITRQTQQRSLDTLGKELSQFANELNERLDRGLQRIEQSTARSASLVSQEQRGALHTVVQELSLSVRQGVEHHLSELRGALQRAIEHQTSVTGGLAETFERMVENSHTQDRVARTLAEAASAVEAASGVMRSSTSEMQPVLAHIAATSEALADTASRINDTQQVVARTAEGVRSSLEFAASGVDEQRKFIERSLSEIRRSLVGLGDGLGASLARSLREVDDVLGSTVGQLRDTLAESNETIERLAGPIRAAEGSTRETHLALDRVRGEVEALGQWVTQASKPLRSGLLDVESRAEDISRALVDFANQTRQIDKTMEALRVEIHEESLRLQGTGSDLGRRLSQASDAIGLLESTTSDAARRVRTDPASASRNHNWSAAPADPAPQPAHPSPARAPLNPETEAPKRPLGASAAGGSRLTSTPSRAERESSARPTPRTPERDAKSPREDVAGDSTGRDLAVSGYRMGAPRAQGPDPYERFDSADSSLSNVRHFPTRDRELGDDLKLSGLLGPSGFASDTADQSDGRRDEDPEHDPTAKRSSSPAADDSE